MTYGIIYQPTKSSGQLQKWVASVNYASITKNLLEEIKTSPHKAEVSSIPFILTLCAWLEAEINDWLIIDTFNKHGAQNYKDIAEGYIYASFANKLRLVVPILTDNTFQLRTDSQIVKTLDGLIKLRNRLTHPKSFFFEEPKSKAARHPIPQLSPKECSLYFEAVQGFIDKFFGQYDRGYIEENDLIKEIEQVGERVPKETNR